MDSKLHESHDYLLVPLSDTNVLKGQVLDTKLIAHNNIHQLIKDPDKSDISGYYMVRYKLGQERDMQVEPLTSPIALKTALLQFCENLQNPCWESLLQQSQYRRFLISSLHQDSMVQDAVFLERSKQYAEAIQTWEEVAGKVKRMPTEAEAFYQETDTKVRYDLQGLLSKTVNHLKLTHSDEQIYHVLQPALDEGYRHLYWAAEKITGFKLEAEYIIEDSIGWFNETGGAEDLRFLEAAAFGERDYDVSRDDVVSSYSIPTNAPEYTEYREKLFTVGLQDILTQSNLPPASYVESVGSLIKFEIPALNPLLYPEDQKVYSMEEHRDLFPSIPEPDWEALEAEYFNWRENLHDQHRIEIYPPSDIPESSTYLITETPWWQRFGEVLSPKVTINKEITVIRELVQRINLVDEVTRDTVTTVDDIWKDIDRMEKAYYGRQNQFITGYNNGLRDAVEKALKLSSITIPLNIVGANYLSTLLEEQVEAKYPDMRQHTTQEPEITLDR